MIWDQANVAVRFDTGSVQHNLVAGIEGGQETSKPEFDNSSGVPTVPLLNPDPHLPFVAASTFPRFKADTTGTSFGAYAIDTVKLAEQWEVNLGLRWDYFAADYKATRFSTTTPGLVTGNDRLLRIDRMPSYRAALVYKPQRNGSIYFDYGTSFNPSAESLSFIINARAFGIGNAFLAPEKNQTVELGTKWDLLNNQLSLTGAVFRLEKQNARVPDPTNPGFNILEGTQRVDGFSLQGDGASDRGLADHRRLHLSRQPCGEIGGRRGARGLAARQHAEKRADLLHRIPAHRPVRARRRRTICLLPPRAERAADQNGARLLDLRCHGQI